MIQFVFIYAIKSLLQLPTEYCYWKWIQEKNIYELKGEHKFETRLSTNSENYNKKPKLI